MQKTNRGPFFTWVYEMSLTCSLIHTQKTTSSTTSRGFEVKRPHTPSAHMEAKCTASHSSLSRLTDHTGVH